LFLAFLSFFFLLFLFNLLVNILNNSSSNASPFNSLEEALEEIKNVRNLVWKAEYYLAPCDAVFGGSELGQRYVLYIRHRLDLK